MRPDGAAEGPGAAPDDIQKFDLFIVSVVLVSVACAILQTDIAQTEQFGRAFQVIELSATVVFVAEYVIRLRWSGGHRSRRSFFRHVTSWDAVIDLLSLAPFFLSLFTEIDLVALTAVSAEAQQPASVKIISLLYKPEAFQGRMKSISFEVASALLFKRDDDSDLSDAEKLNIKAIDLVVVNLYPFATAVLPVN